MAKDDVTITFTGSQIGFLYHLLDSLAVNSENTDFVKGDLGKLKNLVEVCSQAMTKNLMGRINESDAKPKAEDSYYAKQLDTLFPLNEGGISVQFFGAKGKTKQLSLNDKTVQAIVRMFKRLNLIQPEENPDLTGEFQKILEEQYNIFSNIPGSQFRTILAYLYWKDGADWEFVEEVWHKDPHWTVEVCMEELKRKFNYGGQE